MNINFVSFLHPERFSGGGELDNRMIIDKGRQLGNDIRIGARVTHKYWSRLMAPVMKLHTKPDLWILSDLFNVPEYKLSYKKKWLENIIQNEPYIHLDNAYVDICSNGALPCGGCKLKCTENCGYPLTEMIYDKSRLNVFLSPLHERIINGMFDNKYIDKSFVVRPLIDTDRFYKTGVERDIDYLYVGTISYYKGYGQLKDRFSQEKNFLFIGKNATGEPLFGKHIEHVENVRLIEYFNRSKNFVHLPEWNEPMGRTVIEAALCGCNIISNERVGACSFEFDISNPVNSKNAAKEFWNKIKSVV
ncbi:glycosyltransferase [Flavihumibacter sp. UBA7668]|uniref:glycosyltransferase n=1 Tax=Flavihumibacter sp. UBA7668 TaxID=1946542 RepID=UPI0025C1FBB6|nr:glycosyltransferase [Flavihumibacter sp. UBA7668]